MLDVQVEGSCRKSAGSARLLFLFSDVELNPTDTAARGSSLTGRLVEGRGAEAEAEAEARLRNLRGIYTLVLGQICLAASKSWRSENLTE